MTTFRLRLALILTLLILVGCRTPRSGVSRVKDGPVVTTAPEDQRATAFCWAYAIVAHLEQRYYERTRGVSSGGFRLNFSEEYLGLVHLVRQLQDGKMPSEGLRLSESLALVDQFGIVPESVAGQPLFKTKFDEAVAPKVQLEAQILWAAKAVEEGTPLAPAEALRTVAKAASLTEKQTKFLAGAMQIAELGAPADAEFQYANETQTPQKWAKIRLKFSLDDYFVLRFPDSGRGQNNESPFNADYVRALKLVKKALLYGYSVPISFNFVEGSKQENGVVGCVEKACWDASLASPSASSPHANHAVLLIDYRTASSRLEAPTEASLAASFDAEPTDWVIKNSWGFNHNTSSDPALLKRFPLPAYTLMTQDFFEISHKLVPDRYEALLPRDVCLRDLTPQRPWICEKLEDTVETIDAKLVLGNVLQASGSRYAVEFKANVAEIAATDPHLALVDAGGESPDELTQISLQRETVVAANGKDSFRVCAKVEAAADIRYVAVYAEGAKAPSAVLSPQSGWRHCAVVTAAAGTQRKIVLQALDKAYKTIGQISTRLTRQPE